jgi:hypothetical protein
MNPNHALPVFLSLVHEPNVFHTWTDDDGVAHEQMVLGIAPEPARVRAFWLAGLPGREEAVSPMAARLHLKRFLERVDPVRTEGLVRFAEASGISAEALADIRLVSGIEERNGQPLVFVSFLAPGFRHPLTDTSNADLFVEHVLAPMAEASGMAFLNLNQTPEDPKAKDFYHILAREVAPPEEAGALFNAVANPRGLFPYAWPLMDTPLALFSRQSLDSGLPDGKMASPGGRL